MSLFTPEPTQPETPLHLNEPRLMTREGKEPAPGRTAGPRRRLPLRKLCLTAGLLLAMLLVTLVSLSLWWRHSMRAALPQVDGSLRVSGLAAPVTVTRDDHGVPSLQAATLDDLLFAQGFVTAQDRLWQMDVLRRHAAGELAELLGSNLVAHDRTQRYLQLRATADHAIQTLPPSQLQQLEAYARGVNAFINANADHLPVEFHVLHYTPAAWTPRDSLLVSLAMAQDLSTEFPTKLTREALGQHLPPELMADLYPVGSWRDHPPGQATPDLTSPKPEIEQIPLDDSQSRLTAPAPGATPEDLLATKAALMQQTCSGCRSGSNNWAVAGSRSASGMPLVSNDMHLSLGIPDIWYEASLHAADGSLDVAGLTLPGTPFVIVGRNAHIAWGFTNLGADVQDLYIEHLRGSGDSTQFQKPDGTWAPVAHHPEHIRVRGGADQTVDVQTTTHSIGPAQIGAQIATPIITPLYPSEHRALSLAWTVYDPGNVTEPFFAVNTAKDGPGIVAAFASFGGPSLNLIYADDANHIGYHALGRIPVRGPAVHHPVAPPPDVPHTDGEAPPADDDSASSAQPLQPRLLDAAFRPRSRRPAHASRAKPEPKPEPAAEPEEAPAPPPPPPLGYTIGSAIPAVPVDALNAEAQWSGYIPYAELPAVTDPADGVLATANARITPDGYPYSIALDWASPYRVERITRLLAGRTGLTPADMLRTQMDIHSEFDLALAHRIAYALDQSALAHPEKSAAEARRLHQAADILRNWNGDVDAEAAAPNIIAAGRYELLNLLLTAQIAAHDGAARTGAAAQDVARLYAWDEQGYALEQLVLHSPKRWLPAGTANWNDLLTQAVSGGLDKAHAPGDLAIWGYGKAHPVQFNHPVLSMSPIFAWMLGLQPGSGPLVTGGDTSTVKATSRGFGPTERFTADLRDPNATTSNITTGQSGNPVSPWYLDQLPAWLAGTTLPLPLGNAPATHTLTLRPISAR